MTLTFCAERKGVAFEGCLGRRCRKQVSCGAGPANANPFALPRQCDTGIFEPITDRHLSHAFVMVNAPIILQAAHVKTSRKRAWEHHSLICALESVNDICKQVWSEIGLQKARCAMLQSISRKACPRRLGSSPAFAASYPQCTYSTGTSYRRTARNLRHFRTC